MTVKVAINGYGRIGRNVLKALFESGRTSELEIVALNDLGDADSNAYLTKYDTAHGIFPFDVEVKGDALAIDGKEIKVFAERDPENYPGLTWGWMWFLSAPGFLEPKNWLESTSKQALKKWLFLHRQAQKLTPQLSMG